MDRSRIALPLLVAAVVFLLLAVVSWMSTFKGALVYLGLLVLVGAPLLYAWELLDRRKRRHLLDKAQALLQQSAQHVQDLRRLPVRSPAFDASIHELSESVRRAQAEATSAQERLNARANRH